MHTAMMQGVRKGRLRRAVTAVVEAMEPRRLLAAAPAAPGVPDLVSSCDSGISTSDNITFYNNSGGLPLAFDIAPVVSGSTVYVKVDGVVRGSALATGSTARVTLSLGFALSDGTHAIIAYQDYQKGKKITADSPALEIVVDTVAPAGSPWLSLTATSDSGASPADNLTNVTAPTFAFDAQPYYRFYGDGALLSDDYSQGTLFTVPAQSDGAHLFAVSAVDAAGNESAGTSLAVTIDTTAPAQPTLAMQASSDSGISDSDRITNVATPTLDLGNISDRFRLYLDDGLMLDGDASQTTWTAPVITYGTHSLRLEAYDQAGNSAMPVTLVFVVDRFAPAMLPAPDLQSSSDTGISSIDDITADSTPTFSIAAAQWFRFYVDGVLVSSPYASGTSFTTPALADGRHTVSVSAVDDAGNESARSSLSITIVTQAPKPAALQLNATSETGVSYSDGITSRRDLLFVAPAGWSFLELYRSGTLVGTFAQGYPVQATAQPEGTWQYTVIGTDIAGNRSPASDLAVVTIDTVAPAMPPDVDLLDSSDTGLSSSDNITADNTPIFFVQAGPYFRVYIDGMLASSQYATGSEWASPRLQDGVHRAIVYAVDAAGNMSPASQTLTFTIDTTPATIAPALVAASDSGISNSDRITNITDPIFGLSAYAGLGDIELLLDGAPVPLAPGAVSVQVFGLADGTHTLTSLFNDVAGNASQGSLSFTIDTVAPDAPAIPDLLSEHDSGLSNTDNITSLRYFNIVTASTLYQLWRDGTLVSDPYATSQAITVAVSEDGTYTFTARALDVAGNVSLPSAILHVTVDTVAPDAPAMPDLLPEYDSGMSDSDNLTNIQWVMLRAAHSEGIVKIGMAGTGPEQPYYLAQSAGQEVNAWLLDGMNGFYAVVMDVAGNHSAASPTLYVTVDLAAPTRPAAPRLVGDTGGTVSDTTPTFELLPGAAYESVWIAGSAPYNTALVGTSVDYLEIDSATGHILRRIAPHPQVEYWSAEQGMAVSGTDLYHMTRVSWLPGPTLYRYDLASGAFVSKLTVQVPYAANRYPVSALAWLDGGLYSIDNTGAIVRIDPSTGALTLLPAPTEGGVRISVSGGLAGSPDRRTLFAASGTDVVELNPATGAVIQRIATGKSIRGLAYVSGAVVATHLYPTNTFMPDLWRYDVESGAVTHVGAVDHWNGDMTLGGDGIAQPARAEYYRVYRDGVKISEDYVLPSSFTDDSALEGTHVYTVTAVDAAGNESLASDPLVLTFDFSNPLR